MEIRQVARLVSGLVLAGAVGALAAWNPTSGIGGVEKPIYATGHLGPNYAACAPTEQKGTAIVNGLTQSGGEAEISAVADSPIGQNGSQIMAAPVGNEAAVPVGTLTNEKADISACEQPQNSLWLLGASTQTGSESSLLLSNPAPTATTVTLRGYTKTGPADLVQSRLRVEGHKSVRLPLAGIAPDSERLSLQLTASGRGISAWIFQSESKGLDHLGSEVIEAAGSASKTNLIAGAGFANAKLQLTNPGARPAKAQVIRIEGDKSSPVAGGDIKIQAGTVTELSLDGLGQGRGGLLIRSDQPLVVASKQAQNNDFSWTSAQEGDTSGTITMPKLDAEVYATSVAGAKVVLTGPNGQKHNLEVGPMGSAKMKLPEGSWVWNASGPVAISGITYQDGISTFSGSKSAQELTALAVRIR